VDGCALVLGGDLGATAEVDANAAAGELAEQAPSFGELRGGVEGDGVPDRVDLVSGEPFCGEDRRGEVSAVDLEPMRSVAGPAEADVVQCTGGEEQLGIVVPPGEAPW